MNTHTDRDGIVAGLEGARAVHRNLDRARLIEAAVRRGEAELTDGGALAARTGAFTGRSPGDKHVVARPSIGDAVDWRANRAMTPEAFAGLKRRALAHAAGRELFVQDLFAGADPRYRIGVRVVTEEAWHALFARNMFIRPEAGDLQDFAPDWTVLQLPSFKAEPGTDGTASSTVIALDFEERLVVVGNTSYAGEIKKSIFTVMNFLLPAKNVLPMHCSANVGPDGDAALFFGLSGTGKTTLSADPARTLIGDDEHGWGDAGIFNFEGGCYAKAIGLDPEAEPEIHAASDRFGAVLENVVLDPKTRRPDYDDGSLAENSRTSYPLDFIPNASPTGRAGHPANLVMLTADAFGVLPPIAILSPEQAMYHFLSGYTAKLAGTERGVDEPKAVFSACFGAPFMPRRPEVYAKLLGRRIAEHGTRCWLVNTGWTGGAYGEGRRMPLKATRALLAAALDGRLAEAPTRTDPVFGLRVPTACPGVDAAILDPRGTWADPAAFDRTAAKVAGLFAENFRRFEDGVGEGVRKAAIAA
ncbi:MAG: phosphoenolpyruvate carboxykinase [Geminicoccaceae bacterium]|nr:phosphoenolpyruvate carboxykinase [Geminicoccaceae bacterium]